jgi:hypothetical protein
MPIETTDIEKKSLEAHVELCAERYRALELQFNEVKQDIYEVKEVSEKTHNLVSKLAEKRNNQLINWGIGIIGTLVAAIGWLLANYVLK